MTDVTLDVSLSTPSVEAVPDVGRQTAQAPDADAAKSFSEAMSSSLKENDAVKRNFEAAVGAFAESVAALDLGGTSPTSAAIPAESAAPVHQEMPVLPGMPVLIKDNAALQQTFEEVVRELPQHLLAAGIPLPPRPEGALVAGEVPPPGILPGDAKGSPAPAPETAWAVPAEKPLVAPLAAAATLVDDEKSVDDGEVQPTADALVAAGVAVKAAADVPTAAVAPSDALSVQAVNARAAEMVDRVAATQSAADVLVAAAEAVADAILVSPGLLRGEGEIRVQLKPDVLEGTEVRIAVAGRQMAVEFMPVVTEVAALIERCRPQLEQQLAARVHAFSIGVSVKGVSAADRRKGEEALA